MHKLPSDLNNSLINMEDAIRSSYEIPNKRFTIDYKFEGLKLTPIALRIFSLLSEKYRTLIAFSDIGSASLAKRDYPDLKDKIFTFKSFTDSEFIKDDKASLISINPQPFDFEDFEPMCEEFFGNHFVINPKFEDINVGIGSVIRDRRNNFVKTWKNLYYLQPLNKGALMHSYPNNWQLFKEENSKYSFVKEFNEKPDNEEIFINL